MKTIKVLPVLLLLFVFCGCYTGAESTFTGCYAIEEGGKPEVKIEKQGNKFFVLLREGNGWSEKTGLHTGKEEEFSDLFGADTKKIKASLVADEGVFGIFHVNPNEEYGGEKAKTEYLAFIILGGGSVYKINCND